MNDQSFEFSENPELTAFLNRSDDGVFYVGHASVLVRLNQKLFLFDPVCNQPPYLDSWVFFPAQVVDPRFFKVDGVFVSHCHQDHFDLAFLKSLSPEIPIYIVAGRPDFEAAFEAAGLKTVKIPVGAKLDIGSGVTVTGCLHEYNTIDSSIVIQNDNLTVYHGNDNYVTDKTLAPLKKLVGDVHVGCIPFAFIHWYPFLLDGVQEEWRDQESERLINKYLDMAIVQADILEAQLVIPFGANLVYFDDAYSVMNKACLSPIDFVNYAQKKLGDAASKYKPMFAGAQVFKPRNSELSWEFKPTDRATFLENLQTHLKSRHLKRNDVEPTDVSPQLANDLTWLERKLQSSNVDVDHLVLIESTGQSDLKIEIDLKNKTAKRVEAFENAMPAHLFKVAPFALEKWLDKSITFEEVIGTRRFRVERTPNEYNLKVLEALNTVL